MPDIFGAAAGISAAEADQRANEVHQLSMAEGVVKLKEAELTLAQQQKMLQMMQSYSAGGLGGGGQQTPTSAAHDLGDDMYALSRMAMAAGAPDKAAEYARAGSQVKSNAATIQKNQIEAQAKEADLIGRVMGNVVDQKSWTEANATIAMMTGKPSRWGQRPYSPQLVQSIINTSQSIKDRALTQADVARTKALDAEADDRRMHVELMKSQKQLDDERIAALRKVGASGKIPTASNLRAVSDLIHRDYDTDNATANARARPIAERMQELIRGQRLSQSEAANKAYLDAKAQGDLGGLRPMHQRPGATPAKAKDLPMSGGKVDKSQLRDNSWYNVKGQPRLLMNGQFYTADELKDLEETDNADEPASENPDDTAPAVERSY